MKSNQLTREWEPKVEKILRSYFVDKDKDNHWGTPERVDKIVHLISEQLVLAYDRGITEGRLISLEEIESQFNHPAICFKKGKQFKKCVRCITEELKSGFKDKLT